MDGTSAVSDQNIEDSAVESVREVTNVYIWDMDETLILLKSLLNGTYAEAFNGLKDVLKGVEIGKIWENHILQLCDESFFYEQIENYNTPFLDALSRFDDGRDLSDYDFNEDGFNSPRNDENKRKLAYRHRVIANKYMQGLPDIIDQDMTKHWNELYDLTDEYTDRWLSSARILLEQCSGGKEEQRPCLTSAGGLGYHNNSTFKHINVLVTSGSLIPSLVKCLLFRLDNLITHGNVYSSWEVGKLQCLQWIKDRFNNANVQFCVIGDGWEECEAAQAMRWPFLKVDPRPGGTHRFPGLTPRTIGHYFSVVYGSSESNAENDDEKSSHQ